MTTQLRATDASERALTYEERPAFFPAGGETLFGILTCPLGGANGVAVTMVTGGGYVTSTHRNRGYVRVARLLAGLGYHCLRLDYHGTGESTGKIDVFKLARPFHDDVKGGVAWLDSQGLDRHILVGSCFGSYSVLRASASVERLEGVVLVSTPAKDYGYYTDEDRQVISTNVVEPFQRLVERRVPILLAYGVHEKGFRTLQETELLPPDQHSGDLVQTHVIDGPLHQCRTLDVQEAAVDLIVEWFRSRAAGPGG